jgi:hypothetical protein
MDAFDKHGFRKLGCLGWWGIGPSPTDGRDLETKQRECKQLEWVQVAGTLRTCHRGKKVQNSQAVQLVL